MSRPYQERILSENIVLRKFSQRVQPGQLVWHRDKENRLIEVLSGTGWLFQRDNKLPVILEEGDRIKVKAGEYHRLIKGDEDLYVKIYKEGKKKKKLTKKQKKIAQAAPPPDEITGADFKALNKSIDELSGVPLKMRGQHDRKGYASGIYENEESLDEKHDANYEAPEGSKRDKQLDQTKKDFKKAKELRKKGKAKEAKALEQRAYARREKMEKKHRKNESMTRRHLRQLILEVLKEEMLDSIPEEDEADLGEGLSAKTKATLRKKAKKRGLTPSSVYREFIKGLAAWASSGSRKGMSQHQWAHARVNSATPSK